MPFINVLCGFDVCNLIFAPEAVTAQRDSVVIWLELAASRKQPLLGKWGFLVEPLDAHVGSPYPVPPTAWVRCIFHHMKKVITFTTEHPNKYVHISF